MSRRSPSRAGLDRQSVVRAAAALINAEGSEALTINRLARDLGVQPPSLYNHIDGLADLWSKLAVLNVVSLGDRLQAAILGRSGPVGVMALAQAYRSYVKEFPGLYLSSLRSSGKLEHANPALQAAEERIVQAVLALVHSFGIEGDAAVHAVRALRSAVHGFSSLEIAGGFGMPLDTDESFRRMVEMVIAGLSADKP